MKNEINRPQDLHIKHREDLSKFKMGCLEIDRQIIAKRQSLDSTTRLQFLK